MEGNVKLILEDGTEYAGTGFGCMEEKKLELVFNTSMVGYQEILSDPSYTDQAVVMTYPVIGNYGINEDDFETKHPSIGALIVRDYTEIPSNFRSKMSLSAYMRDNRIAGIQNVDTREITRKIRDYGSCKALLTTETTAEQGKKILQDWDYATDQVRRVSTREIRVIEPAGTGNGMHVIAIDCGMKENIVRSLHAAGCKVTVVPFDTDAGSIRAMKPDGIFISNGPGDPENVTETIRTVKALHGFCPIFGICLGHQILALSYGAKTYKLKFGHRGGNHPVKNLLTGKLEITSQNHSYAVDTNSIAGTGLQMTHENLLDHTVEGILHREDRAFSVQYHPESAPGPQDSRYLFAEFIAAMKGVELYA
ncbi:MAG: glutamine-hydrolyzing carbamoyl-phosphate synthase small subunit [Lachnospiraceae bacterium]|nr:glutamine-hydrolyzing carbamoyl-phosphate synthase small subunit [Lachnospiraceae bacterium]